MTSIDAALHDLSSQDVPNIAAIAIRHNLDSSTLSRRWRGKAASRGDYVDSKSLLTRRQQKYLVAYINNKLTSKQEAVVIALSDKMKVLKSSQRGLGAKLSFLAILIVTTYHNKFRISLSYIISKFESFSSRNGVVIIILYCVHCIVP